MFEEWTPPSGGSHDHDQLQETRKRPLSSDSDFFGRRTLQSHSHSLAAERTLLLNLES
jgi:hypothetical protein